MDPSCPPHPRRALTTNTRLRSKCQADALLEYGAFREEEGESGLLRSSCVLLFRNLRCRKAVWKPDEAVADTERPSDTRIQKGRYTADMGMGSE